MMEREVVVRERIGKSEVPERIERISRDRLRTCVSRELRERDFERQKERKRERQIRARFPQAVILTRHNGRWGSLLCPSSSCPSAC